MYCITEQDKTDIVSKLTEQSCVFAIVGIEVGAHGVPHLQGFAHLSKQVRFSAAKDIFGRQAHIEPAFGSDTEKFKYCSKGGNVLLRVGEPDNRGIAGAKNNRYADDLMQYLQGRKAGKTIAQVCEDPKMAEFFVKFG